MLAVLYGLGAVIVGTLFLVASAVVIALPSRRPLGNSAFENMGRYKW